MADNTALTLRQLNARIGSALQQQPGLVNVWVVAETADLRVAGGHCYLELVEKDPESGRQLARLRATIWQSVYYGLSQRFVAETGQQLQSDLQVMVCGTVQYNALYGVSFNIVAINPAYTMGDVLQRRNRMIARLRAEGIIDDNRRLPWPVLTQRIAVISARGAAGYGDFINQLYTNPAALRFYTRLFPAVMQGANTAASVIAALDSIMADDVDWQCVVIIRGGGASSDLLAFDDYDLAATIANYPIPVVIGIGHERDITLLDWVANMRVKTPTAAAEWLIKRGEQQLAMLQTTSRTMLQTVTDCLSGCHRQLAYIAGQLPGAAVAATDRARNHLVGARTVLQSVADRRLLPARALLDSVAERLGQAATFAIDRARTRMDMQSRLLEALSPETTLRRGFSITRVNGRTVRSVNDLIDASAPIHTVLADGTVVITNYTVNKQQ